MKKQLFFIAIAGLFTSMASAADLYVRDFGAGGAYSTISAAITAAADGDRIIIKPKAGGIPYLENLTIDKSLTFVCETNFTKYLVQGSISVTPLAARVVTINNINLTSSIQVSGATPSGRTTLNVFNSIIGGSVDAQQVNTTLNCSGNVVTSIGLTHGRVTANRCAGISVISASLDSNPATDDIEIIANYIVPTASFGVSFGQKNYKFRFTNNYLLGNMNITAVKNASSNEIINNVITNYNFFTASTIQVSLTGTNAGLISIINNVLCSYLDSFSEVGCNTGTQASVYVFYNISNTAFVTATAVTSASSNISNASLTFSTSTYTVTGSGITNGGYPEDDYADIDLSRNDLGNWGGSDSWANYWPTAVGNKPQVNYLSTPRRIYTGTTEMNATGAGHSK